MVPAITIGPLLAINGSIVVSSISASCCPMQPRSPRPKGMNDLLCSCVSFVKRFGLNACDSGQIEGSRFMPRKWMTTGEPRRTCACEVAATSCLDRVDARVTDHAEDESRMHSIAQL